MGIILVLLLFSGYYLCMVGQRIVFSTYTDNFKLDNYHIQSTLISENNSVVNCSTLELNVSSIPYILCIANYSIRYTGIVNNLTDILIQHANYTENLKLSDRLHLACGYVTNYDGSNYVKGYVDKNRFYGRLHLGRKTYCVEPARYFSELKGKFHDDYDAVVYEEVLKEEVNKFAEVLSATSDIFKLDMNPYYGKFVKVTNKYCTLLVAIDNSYVQVFGNGDIERALPRVILNLDEANSVLRSADFDMDNVPDDIGIQVKTILILSSPISSVGSVIETPINDPVDPKSLLKRFTTLEPNKHFCLAVLFTAQPFQKRFLGVSFTPTKDVFDRKKLTGICAPWVYLGFSLNSLAITHKLASGDVMPSSLAELNLAHELAHAFGSDHDDGECERDFIMEPRAGVPDKTSNLEFSMCSKRGISIVLRKQGHCLRNHNTSFCGNGIVEMGEDCDCGSSTHCVLSDPCCVPRGSQNMCKVSNGHSCHPSQGICCSESCQYRNLTYLGLNCTNFNMKCPCSKNSPCNCGIAGTCVGQYCHSSECTRIGLEECLCQKQNDDYCSTCCVVEGKCVPSLNASHQTINKNVVPIKSQGDITQHLSEQSVNVCNRLGKCYDLNFKRYESQQLCLVWGKVGICLNSVCVNPILPEMQTALLRSKANRGFNTIGMIFFFVIFSLF